MADVVRQFSRYAPLPVGEVRSERIEYQERHLITDEVVMRMEIRLPLLQSGVGAISFFREELEMVCSLRGTHAVLAPLIESFLTEMLFVEKLTLFDPRLGSRFSDADVREHVRAVFVPLIRERTTVKEERRPEGAARSVAADRNSPRTRWDSATPDGRRLSCRRPFCLHAGSGLVSLRYGVSA